MSDPTDVGWREGFDTVLDAVLSDQARQVYSAAARTPIVDFAANVSGIALIPSLPGFLFIPSRVSYYFKTLSGTFTGSLTWHAGNNAGQNNVAGATPLTAANLNAQIAATAAPNFLTGAFIGPSAPLLDLVTPVTYAHTGATGGVGTGRVILFGAIVPT